MSKEKEIRSKFSTLYIQPEVLKKIMYYAEAAEGEVSGLGTILIDKEKDLIVDEVFLLEQESSAGDTELKPEAISKLMEDMIKKDQDPGKLKFWWHSHADMGVFWSGTDDACAETLSREWAFSMVVNKRGEKKCRLDLYNPFRITIDNIRVEEMLEEDEDLKEKCKKEVEEKVKSPIERWRGKGWDKDKDRWPGYGGYGGFGYEDYGESYYDRFRANVDLKDVEVKDVERLMTAAQSNEDVGGIFAKETWDDYIKESIKEYIEDRYESKADCSRIGTFDKEHHLCKECKVAKVCAYWTKVFDEDWVDAEEELEEIKEEVIEIK
jgi:hypothetical protein